MEPTNTNGYTVKEILTMFVMPALDDIRRSVAVQDDRIDRLEAWRNRIGGALALVAVAIPAAVMFIPH